MQAVQVQEMIDGRIKNRLILQNVGFFLPSCTAKQGRPYGSMACRPPPLVPRKPRSSLGRSTTARARPACRRAMPGGSGTRDGGSLEDVCTLQLDDTHMEALV